jgi:hypothetical protein
MPPRERVVTLGGSLKIVISFVSRLIPGRGVLYEDRVNLFRPGEHSGTGPGPGSRHARVDKAMGRAAVSGPHFGP